MRKKGLCNLLLALPQLAPFTSSTTIAVIRNFCLLRKKRQRHVSAQIPLKSSKYYNINGTKNWCVFLSNYDLSIQLWNNWASQERDYGEWLSSCRSFFLCVQCKHNPHSFSICFAYFTIMLSIFFDPRIFQRWMNNYNFDWKFTILVNFVPIFCPVLSSFRWLLEFNRQIRSIVKIIYINRLLLVRWYNNKFPFCRSKRNS